MVLWSYILIKLCEWADAQTLLHNAVVDLEQGCAVEMMIAKLSCKNTAMY